VKDAVFDLSFSDAGHSMNNQAKQIRNTIEKASTDADIHSVQSDILPNTPAQTAAYLAELLKEMRDMADRAKMPFLTYLLDIAQEEAESQKNRRF